MCENCTPIMFCGQCDLSKRKAKRHTPGYGGPMYKEYRAYLTEIETEMRQMICEIYVSRKLTYDELATAFGCQKMFVRYAIDKHFNQ